MGVAYKCIPYQLARLINIFIAMHRERRPPCQEREQEYQFFSSIFHSKCIFIQSRPSILFTGLHKVRKCPLILRRLSLISISRASQGWTISWFKSDEQLDPVIVSGEWSLYNLIWAAAAAALYVTAQRPVWHDTQGRHDGCADWLLDGSNHVIITLH